MFTCICSLADLFDTVRCGVDFPIVNDMRTSRNNCQSSISRYPRDERRRLHIQLSVRFRNSTPWLGEPHNAHSLVCGSLGHIRGLKVISLTPLWTIGTVAQGLLS
jgi:hypothetical protein